MAQSITLGVTPVAVGTRQFVIDALPGNSTGYRLIVGLNSTWTGATGRLFDLKVEIALDSGTFQQWVTGGMNGGPVLDRSGNPKSTWQLSGTWPGENDGSGGRRVLRATSMRITLTVAQVFTVQSLSLQTV